MEVNENKRLLYAACQNIQEREQTKIPHWIKHVLLTKIKKIPISVLNC